MNICYKCGKETEHLYGMDNGEFYCKACANIPKEIVPLIDRKDSVWKIKSFLTVNPDQLYFDKIVNEFFEKERPSEFRTEFTSNDKGTAILLIFYR